MRKMEISPEIRVLAREGIEGVKSLLMTKIEKKHLWTGNVCCQYERIDPIDPRPGELNTLAFSTMKIGSPRIGGAAAPLTARR